MREPDRQPPFPSAGGDVAARIADHDWSASPLGPIDQWPLPLKSALDLILRSPVAMVALWGDDGVMLYNDGYAAICGNRHPRILGSKVREAWPEASDFNDHVMRTCLGGGTLTYRDQQMSLQRGDEPETVWLNLDYSPIVDGAGIPRGVMAVCQETTAKVLAERWLSGERERLKRMFEQAPGLAAMLAGPEHVFTMANAAYRRLTGERALLGKPAREALPEAVSQGFIALLDQVYRSGEPYVGRGVSILLRQDPDTPPSERFIDVVYQPVRMGDDEAVTGIFVQGYEVTEQTRLARRLQALNAELGQQVAREVAERVRTEEALVQARRLEAIGKLTGGVAHDFNNLLQIISGNLSLLALMFPGDPAARRRIDSALTGVDRGARLSAQLLAFGRRQALEPQAVQVARLVGDMAEMLRATVGPAVAIEVVAGDDLWHAFADRAQLENALLNLAINARDAMNGSGRLRIELGNADLQAPERARREQVEPGRYVTIAVSDTGTGMSPDVRERAFEPFFSTKPKGKGTGLGLSMVYGFVTQSRGQVRIESEAGQGATIRLLLPQAPQAESREAEPGSPVVVGGTGTVLVAEDDDEVRHTVAALLASFGYQVLTAIDAASALAIVEGDATIDLLFSDVVMPGQLTATELARRARARRPGLPILFTSGYVDVDVTGGDLGDDVELLPKPYSAETLARRIGEVLAASRRGA